MTAAKLGSMPDALYAHTAEGRPWQKLREHLENVAELCAGFAAAFDSAEVGRLIGWAHDLGKSDRRFQAYLLGKGSGCPHALMGAKWLDLNIRAVGRLLAYTVAGHHAGLPDGINGGNANLDTQLQNATGFSQALFAPQNPTSVLPAFLSQADKREWWLWVKMLYSCLVDADWLDTEAFMSPDAVQTRPTDFDSMRVLLDRFTQHMTTVSAEAPKSPVNELRGKVLRSVLQKAYGAPGIYSLTVPTGGGKTLTSLGFALTHAVAQRKQKIIYTIPYSTIIEQTSQTLANVLGGKNVLEHHAEAKWHEEKDEIAIPLRQLTENWAGVPVVVTTNVQFFESLFSAASSKCRKLHNIVDSVIILDEVQKLPEEFLACCAEVLRLLAKDYGCTILLCTATQPDLSMFGLDDVTELVPDVSALYEALRRVDYHDLGRIEDLRIVADKIAAHPSALCVVNSRRDAKELYSHVSKIKGEENTFHLSTWMCPRHRRDVVTMIRHRLSETLPTYVISTSLIEAGVDLDFPVVFRALAGLDSLAQAAGRCNREGRLNGLGQVFLFEKKPPEILKKAVQETKQIGNYKFSLHCADSFRRYSEAYYDMLCDTGHKTLERLWVKESLADCLNAPAPCPFGGGIRFREVSDDFHMISDEDEVPFFVPYDEEAVRQINEAVENGLTKKRLRTLRGICVQVRKRQAEHLMASSVSLQIYNPSTGSMIDSPYRALLDFGSLYSEKTGLNVALETLSDNDLIIDN